MSPLAMNKRSIKRDKRKKKRKKVKHEFWMMNMLVDLLSLQLKRKEKNISNN
eukprot:CAMPEP_0201503870 /NCGR_PEP_ID=MMETSP0151_2-20130828/84902_1 /ASSEMBLY_ACC=CAM_ASM_000257 /TAXON_ID=200890 /ORGANISM="Paramoeba atlantica, Strain 621/1 / CCAP 1560/9" /LENGTH=51 /DNA_ID=CAMNT_0047897567 /DNA_START=994 /DNA_END=1146 /DNA_ORIENTATION=-